MLVFNEGVPRSGKSYDAVLSHILPALRAGRRVYARLNGLDHAAIAVYLGMPLEEVQRLLILVPTQATRRFFTAVRDESGQWSIADDFKDALFVIDECHEFYVSSRNAIEPEIEQFFALHGQNGMDGVLMSQHYRRLHSSVRVRIERKNVFQKLSALGMNGRYNLRMYQTYEPDKFQEIDTKVLKYDPKIFPLYHGYAPDSENKDVYEGGQATVWRKLAKLGIPVGLLLIGSIWFLWHMFHTGGRGLLKNVPSAQSVASAPSSGGAVDTFKHPSAMFDAHDSGHVDLPAKLDTSGMPVEVKYVFDMSGRARARLAGVIAVGDGPERGVVEWREAGSKASVLDRLSFDDLRALGVQVEQHPYGVKLVWRDKAIVVTSWPLDVPEERVSSSDSDRRGLVSGDAVVDAVAGSGAAYKVSAMRADYVPPELMKGPVPSSKGSL